ncbi:hypothetical protein MSAN_01625200 [Mycena sanguinolenta]|uniref:Uncharacterized protein n=1 Tax=Mycena sanguinolenta TaxID=230812 RepID=A0A8H7CU84_9AGAR|nr:hypothetical protein MSAN_01625200 [Mycena sanguinolenta]
MDTTALSDVLAGLRRNKEGEKLASDFLQRLRQNAPFSSIKEDKWQELTAKILRDLPVLARFFLGTGRAGTMDFPRSEEKLSDDRDHEAVRNNVLGKAVEQQVLLKEKTSSRRAIDLIISSAIEVAQKKIAQNQELDLALRARHRLEAHNWHAPDDGEAGSRVVLYNKIMIPPQLVLPQQAFYGVLDVVLAVVPSRDATDARSPGESHSMGDLHSPADLANRLEERLTFAILEANADKPMDSEKARAEAATQGAALCVFTGRPSVMIALTNGLKWQFFKVTKLANPVSQPFNIAKTHVLDVATNEPDLAIVIRLLTVAILFPAEQFGELAAGASSF